MRIITGRYKGLQLKTLPGVQTRPTMDRVRESLFSILGGFVEGAVVLDIFAGSGALGLEALSRGAARVTFVEKSRGVAEVLQSNVDKTRSESCNVITGPVERVLPRLASQNLTFDLVFLDPPYRAGKVVPVLEGLLSRGLLNPDARVVAEHESSLKLPLEIENLFRTDQRKYGDTCLTLYAMLFQEV